ncbi:MAG: helix-turn-helix domain-containing protein [Azoarcus sp.]|nr:helix-turn-helix domain-containing protein [Azoarcus sp.]
MNVGSEAVSRIERGVVIPNIVRLLDFASIFGCEATELLTETSSRPDDQATRISRMLSSLKSARPSMGYGDIGTLKREAERVMFFCGTVCGNA